MGDKHKRRKTDVISINPEDDIARRLLLDSGFIENPDGGAAPAAEPEGYAMKLDDVIYYAYAMDRIAEYCRRTQPTSIISPLRGSYPPTRILVRLLDGFGGPIKYVPTSNFVEDRETMIKKNLEDCIVSAHKDGRENVHIFTVDLAMSGTSTKRYMGYLKQFVPEIISAKKIPEEFGVKYSLIKLWHKPGEVSRNPKRIKTSNPITGPGKSRQYSIEQGVFFIPDWLSEDKPELLGIDYAYCNPDKVGVKLAFAKLVHGTKPIVVASEAGGSQVYAPGPSQSTADVFVDLITAYACDIAAGRLPLPAHNQ